MVYSQKLPIIAWATDIENDISKIVNKLLINPPVILIPFIALAANAIVRMFKTLLNKPRVRKFMGKAKNLIIGVTKKFKSVRKNKNTVAAVTLLISKDGNTLDNIISEIMFAKK
jgi:hypothetical protein